MTMLAPHLPARTVFHSCDIGSSHMFRSEEILYTQAVADALAALLAIFFACIYTMNLNPVNLNQIRV